MIRAHEILAGRALRRDFPRKPSRRVRAKLRYRTDPVWATVRPGVDGFTLDLDEPVNGVAPGQTAVLYDDDAVVGAGVVVVAPQSRAGDAGEVDAGLVPVAGVPFWLMNPPPLVPMEMSSNAVDIECW